MTIEDIDRLNTFYSIPAGATFNKVNQGMTGELVSRLMEIAMEELK